MLTSAHPVRSSHTLRSHDLYYFREPTVKKKVNAFMRFGLELYYTIKTS